MSKTHPFKNQKILVLGLAKSGVSVAKLLHQLGALLTVNDMKPLNENPEARALLNMGIKVVTGEHPADLLEEQFTMVVKNPGIPYSNPIVKKALAKQIPVITEVEVASWFSPVPITAITGTNGKTTTTALTTAILNHNRQKGKAYAVGNIGVPMSDCVLTVTREDDVVVEMSSFQLMGSPTLRPAIAAITNVYSAHLDYHGTQEAYVAAKLQITKRQTSEDYLIYNADQPELDAYVRHHSNATLIPFSIKTPQQSGVYADDTTIYYGKEPVVSRSDIQLSGMHNLQNVLVAVAIAKLKGVENARIIGALRMFKGVAHRSQYVDTVGGCTFINDSKATNALATSKALGGFTQPIILLAGGLDRRESFERLRPYMAKLKACISFGETKDTLNQFAKACRTPYSQAVDTLEEAMAVACQLGGQGDVILLSPACASWDQYDNFEQRGEAFVALVSDYSRKESASDDKA